MLPWCVAFGTSRIGLYKQFKTVLFKPRVTEIVLDSLQIKMRGSPNKSWNLSSMLVWMTFFVSNYVFSLVLDHSLYGMPLGDFVKRSQYCWNNTSRKYLYLLVRTRVAVCLHSTTCPCVTIEYHVPQVDNNHWQTASDKSLKSLVS